MQKVQAIPEDLTMKKTMIIFAVCAMMASGSAMAQHKGGLKAGATRDGAIAASTKAFGKLDQNGDGAYDNAEVTAMLQARATKSGKAFKPKAAKKMIARYDTNADGKVTLDEFKAAAGTRFDQADTNKNGVIDADEVKAPAAAAAGAGGANE
jgi:hypothetical protein